MAKSAKPSILDKQNDPRAKHDWHTLRKEYIEGIDDGNGTIYYPTVAQLAERHGISNQLIVNKASREKWTAVKSAEMNRVALERQKKLAKLMANKQIKFSEKAAEDAMQTQIALGKRILQLTELTELDNARISVLMDRIEAGEKITPAFRGELKGLVSSSEWESLWKAYALANEVGRKALGMKDGDEPAQTNNTFITQVNNTGPTQILKDTDRTSAILAALQNPNMVIPGVTVDVPELEDTLDAEVVEDDDNSESE